MKITPTYHLFIILIFNVCFFSNLYSQINQNNLKFESSSYLLQHAKNPINWQRWDNKLYNLINKDKKLIVVSIGYSSCHWCQNTLVV